MSATSARAVFWLTALPLGVLYGATAAQTVTGEDSGELITAAHQLAVAHPPGYPLWLLLTKGFQLLFSGVSVAHASALASGVTTAATCGLLAVVGLRLGLGAVLSVAAGLVAGIAHEVWNHATIAEVYPLALFLFVAGVLLLLRWRDEPTLRRWFALTFMLGTGVAHHPLLLLFGPVFALAAVAAHPRVALHWKSALIAVLGLALPFLVYLQAWYAAAHEPALSWGLRPELASLAAHWNREAYSGSAPKTALTLAKLAAQLGAVARFHVENFTLPGALLGLGGLAVLARRGAFAGRLVAALYVAGTGLLLAVLRFDLEREDLFANRVFLLPAYLCLALAAGSAVRAALDRLSDPARPRLAFATLLAPLALSITGFPAHDRSNYRWSEEYGRAILDGCPQDALLFPGGDTSTFPLLYLQYIEGYRRDVRLLDRSGTVERAEALAFLPESARPSAAEAPREELLAILARKSGKPVVSLRPERRDEDLASVPCGLGFVVLGAADKKSAESAQKRQTDFLAALKLRNEMQSTVADYTADLIRSHLAQVRAAEAFARGRPADAVRLCDDAVLAARGIKETYNNVGSLLADHGEFDRAVVRFQEALAVRADYALARRNLATVLRGLGRPADALAVAAAGLGFDPGDPFLFQEALGAAEALDDGRAVKRLCAVRISAAPADPEPHRRLGDWAKDREASPATARVHYEAALRLDPDDERTKRKLAELPADDALPKPEFPLPETALRPFAAADLAARAHKGAPYERSEPRSPKFRRAEADEQRARALIPGSEQLAHLRAQLTGAGWTDPAAELPRLATNGEDR